MTIRVINPFDIPCSLCVKIRSIRSPFRGVVDNRAVIGHLRQVGDTVLIGRRENDAEIFYQCPTCGALWRSHRDYDPDGKSWALFPLFPGEGSYPAEEKS